MKEVVVAVQTTTTHPRRRMVGSIAARTVLTVLGAAGLIVGAFLDFVDGIVGTRLSWSIFYRADITETGSFFRTVGVVMIALGLVALIGLAMHSGWLTRLAGVLGIIGVVLVGIGVYRVAGGQTMDVGVWICLAGSVLALIGGFFGVPRTSVIRIPEADTTTAPVTTAAGTTTTET
jgi:hypothetical protein